MKTFIGVVDKESLRGGDIIFDEHAYSQMKHGDKVYVVSDDWIDLYTHPKIEHGSRVWFGNIAGVWAGRWDEHEHHKGLGRAYPTHVMKIEVPELPICYQQKMTNQEKLKDVVCVNR